MPYAANVYSVPPGTTATTLTAIDSSDYNAFVEDIEQAQNDVRPIVAGGTGVDSAIKASSVNTASNHQALLKDLGGVNTVAGTGDAITVTAALSWTAYGTGDGQIGTGTRLTFKAGAANTTATTINVNSLGTKAIRKISGGSDVALVAGDILAGVRYEMIYDSAANSAAGAWILRTPNRDAKGGDIASAATITVSHRYHHVTGTTTITDIDFTDAVDGRWAWLIFDGALTLTHNSTTLKLPGGASITTAAGDRALFIQDSSDNVICLEYVPAAVPPITSGTWTPSLGGNTTYTDRRGYYQKIGNRVYFECFISVNSIGTGSVSTISGLPFTSANTTSLGTVAVGFFSSLAANVVFLTGNVAANATTIIMRSMSGAAATTVTATCFGNGTIVHLTGNYTADA